MKTFAAYWPSSQAVRWRTLTWKEYNHFQALERAYPEQTMKVALDLYRTVVLEGPEPDFVLAGIAQYVADFCLQDNPFSGKYEDISQALEIKRNNLDYLGHARALVAGLFHYSFEEMDTWDADLFFERLAQAEFLAGQPLVPSNPNAVEEPQKTSQSPQKVNKKPLSSSQQKAFERVQQRGR